MQEHEQWKEVMALAEKYKLIIHAFSGVAVLATHQEQIKAKNGMYYREEVCNCKDAVEMDNGWKCKLTGSFCIQKKPDSECNVLIK